MNEKYLELFNQQGLPFGKILGSKSLYRTTYPNHLIVFNSRIYLKSFYITEKDGKIRDFFKGQEDEIWYGDLDLNKDIFKLYKIAYDIGEILVITSEIGNKIVEIGEYHNKTWIGTIGNKGITLKELRETGE